MVRHQLHQNNPGELHAQPNTSYWQRALHNIIDVMEKELLNDF